MAKVSRRELLARLLAVDAAVVKSQTVRQSNCVVLKGGRFYTMSTEVSCSIASGLPKEDAGAVDADRLTELLKRLPDDEVDVRADGVRLHVRGGGGRRSALTMETELLQPQLPRSELPKDWKPLHADFAAAADVTHRCTKKKDSFAKECVHVHPEFLEASDNASAVRFPVPTFVSKSVLVRGSTVKHVTQLGFAHACETAGWLHFHNPTGLRMSLRKFALEKYPPLGDYFKLRGRPVEFPGALSEAALRAALFPDAEGDVTVVVSEGSVYVRGKNPTGEYEEELSARYRGPDMVFSIPPKTLADLATRETRCEVCPRSVRVDCGGYVYVAALEMKPCSPSATAAAASARSNGRTSESAPTSTPAPAASIPARR